MPDFWQVAALRAPDGQMLSLYEPDGPDGPDAE
jgi:hypothetical protein